MIDIEDKINKLKERIEELVPDVRIKNRECHCTSATTPTILRPIRLADVLLAIEKHFDFTINDSWLPSSNENLGLIDIHFVRLLIDWNLERNSLDEQSEETIDYLIKLFSNV